MGYTYKAENAVELGRDRMRFELGDVMVEGGSETCALTDEEYDSVLSRFPAKSQWKRAKLEIIKSVLFKFSYEVDTRVGPLDLKLSERYNRWKKMFDDLQKELAASGAPWASPQMTKGLHHFEIGMHDHPDYICGVGGGKNVS